ncbi:MAG: tetratricopeptide repeat protein [Proteobacteria bacterium]|nr:tetratricopeptide repeat protein [Pseudomonadota bacterium]
MTMHLSFRVPVSVPVRRGARSLPCLLLLAALAAPAGAGEAECGPLTNHYGPFDYNAATPADRALVDRAHFTPRVEQLKRGNTGSLGQDLSYTLGVFPNHARALLAISNLALREKTPRPKDSTYSIDCWFDRAFRFRPNEGNPRMIYGVYLMKSGRTQEAIEHLETAARLAGESANLNYNLGLAYFELNDHEKALAYAHRAYAQGFQLPGLKSKLQKAGKWRDAGAGTASPAADAPAAGR